MKDCSQIYDGGGMALVLAFRLHTYWYKTYIHSALTAPFICLGGYI